MISQVKPRATSSVPKALSWDAGKTVLRLLDQTRLPAEEVYLSITDMRGLEDCILRLVVRGAPAIGCAAAFGVYFAASETPLDLAGDGVAITPNWLQEFDRRCAHLASTRPTAVNLGWAVERCRKLAHRISPQRYTRDELLLTLEKEALLILDEDRQMCTRIGQHGLNLLNSTLGGREKATIMTHCNAGALATGGSGTALAVLYEAHRNGLGLRVFADETRPLLQGARLTAWELARAGIDVTVICDNMAATVMRDYKPDAVIVGADRIAANGDTANKIGTYGLAILARYHNVPFFVAAPSSTFDQSIPSGAGIPIEQRARREIAEFNGKLCTPENAGVFNPAFDVTPAGLITAHITENGIWSAQCRT